MVELVNIVIQIGLRCFKAFQTLNIRKNILFFLNKNVVEFLKVIDHYNLGVFLRCSLKNVCQKINNLLLLCQSIAVISLKKARLNMILRLTG